MTDTPKKTKLSDFTDDEIRQALQNAPESAKLHISTLKNELQNRMKRTAAQQGFMAYVNQVWPNFIHGRHHAKMAAAFERVARGECKRLIINMPPRHTKSEFASYLLPSWFLGLYPGKKVIQTSHTAELAVDRKSTRLNSSHT